MSTSDDIALDQGLPVARLGDLLAGYADVPVGAEIEVNALQLSSRRVQPGDLFFALPGLTMDGRDYIDDAIAKGAAAVVYEKESAPHITSGSSGSPVIAIEGLKSRIGHIASRFYGSPSSRMEVVGVTGTNGKTTTAWLIAQALTRLGNNCGYSGTIGTGRVEGLRKAELTTADAIAIQEQMHEFQQSGMDAVCMEVSSHGLDQGRVNGVDFDVGVFTNLSQDHLDYHHDMEQYGRAKRRLFEFETLQCAVVNTDDGFGKELARKLQESHHNLRCIRYGMTSAELMPFDLEVNSRGIRFNLFHRDMTLEVKSGLIGEFNTWNLLAVAGVLLGLGHDPESVAGVFPLLTPPPGRMEIFRSHSGGPSVVVDYAHTPDALERALHSMRKLCPGNLSVVFGCGGNRDQGKRPIMGKIAQQIADRVIVTDDNPRNESAQEITAQIEAGMKAPATIIHDRREAIYTAVREAGPGDMILVAGKGHEESQTTGCEVVPLSDRVLVREILEARS